MNEPFKKKLLFNQEEAVPAKRVNELELISTLSLIITVATVYWTRIPRPFHSRNISRWAYLTAVQLDIRSRLLLLLAFPQKCGDRLKLAGPILITF